MRPVNRQRPAVPDGRLPGSVIDALLADNAGLMQAACAKFGLGYLVVKRSGAVVDANDHAVRLLGRTVDNLRGLSDVSALLPPSERAKRSAYRRRRRDEADGTETIRTFVVHNDGHRLPVEVVPVPIGDGELTVLIVRDLSELSTRDQLIDWYGALCERMPVGVMIVNAFDTPEGQRLRLWSVNEAACLALGMDLKARLGDTLFSIFPGRAHEDERRLVFSVLGTGRTEHLPDIVIGDRKAPERVYRRVVVSLPGDALAMVIEDITPAVQQDLHRRALMERIVELGDSDRRSIALGIHDDPLQQIAAAALLIGQLRRRDLPPRDEWLADADIALHKAMDSLRQLVFELSPPELVESGLGTALSAAADYLFADTGVWVHVDCSDPQPITGVVLDTAFRIAAEALTNIRKHANASTVQVVVDSDSESLRLTVTDDGLGFDGAQRTGHFGLGHMRDRAEALGGTCGVTTGSAGTTVTAVLPLEGTPAPPPAELAGTLRELDLERAAIRRERDSLRQRITDVTESADQATTRLSVVAGLQQALREAPDSVAERAMTACRFLAGTVADGFGIRLVDSSGSVLRRVASWHRDPTQLEYLNNHVFVDRISDSSHAVLVFRSGDPALMERARTVWSVGDGPLPPDGPIVIHTAIMVPMHSSGRIVGVITGERDQSPVPLTEGDISLFAVLADIIGSHLPLATSD